MKFNTPLKNASFGRSDAPQAERLEAAPADFFHRQLTLSAMYKKSLAIALCSLFAALPALAGPDAVALTSCLSDSTSGKDRKDLAKWVFAAMSTHPEIREFAVVTDKVRDQTSNTVGVLVTRLLSEDCAKQTQAAIRNEGQIAMQTAFRALGGLAMQELMSNPEVTASFSIFEKYLDRRKIEAAVPAR